MIFAHCIHAHKRYTQLVIDISRSIGAEPQLQRCRVEVTHTANKGPFSPVPQASVVRDSCSGEIAAGRRCTTATVEPRRPFGCWNALLSLQS
jgi:hypothetical protein